MTRKCRFRKFRGFEVAEHLIHSNASPLFRIFGVLKSAEHLVNT